MNREEPECDPFRLTGAAVPVRYDLVLEPDLAGARFTGTVRVRVWLSGPCDGITLNAKELEIGWASLALADGTAVPLAGFTLDAAAERATFTACQPLEAGEVDLAIGFQGVLNDKLAGFYRSTFRDDQGRTHVLATTQLQATDARRAFPCFDEPAFKAVFGVTLVIPDGLLAVSNAPAASEEPAGPGKTRVRFADTPRMSSYLVAFIVGPLTATAPVDVDGVALRVVHRPGQESLTRYALEVGAFALRYFARYYRFPYPAPKLDLVAVPDFAFGAMENWGCVTFRDTALLVDEDRATGPELLRVADVVAHEIAHMWFGDLVTMRWWNGTWLNEAFATFMATACVAAFRPEWHRWDQFGRDRTMAFDVDALASTRSIEFPVHSPAEAEGMFDVLTYEKGGSVLRMLEQYLGEEKFREGVHRYLKSHAYGNTETHDLWNALEGVTGEPVRRLMESWIFQPGFPWIDASLAGSGLAVSQQRFSYGPGTGDGEGQLWSVPLLVRRGGAEDAPPVPLLLENQAAALAVPEDAPWVLVNAGSHGFYRVRYDAGLRARLTRHLFELSPAERYVLVDDTWAGVLAGASSAEEFLVFAEAFATEGDVDVWLNLLAGLGQLERLVDAGAAGRYRARVGVLVNAAFAGVGWTPRSGEGPRTLELRGVLVRGLGTVARDDDAWEHCRTLHGKHLAGSGAVEPNLAGAVAAVAASRGTPADYEFFRQRADRASTPQEERRYRFLLATFPGLAEFERTLASTLDGTVRSQDAPYLLGACLEHREHGGAAWRFLTAHWDEILRSFPDNAVVRMLAGVRALATPEGAAEVAAFFAAHPVTKGARTLAQHVEKLRVNVALRQRETPRFADALAGAGKG